MAKSGTSPIETLDAVVIGAGLTGLYHLQLLRSQGFNACIFEAGSGVGGTWYWNRYPGCRFDSESYTYGYFFSDDLLKEWQWSEHYAGQPETERYLNHFADKFELRPHIRLNARIARLTWLETDGLWEVESHDGACVRAQFVVAAVGLLSAPFTPDYPGRDNFTGDQFHTARWPKEHVELEGKRVAVVGTGSTGVQLIPEVAKIARHLTVLQRTPNYTAPLRNGPIGPDEWKDIKARYPAIIKKCKESFAGYIHEFDERSTFDVTPKEREAFYEEIWSVPGFRKWFGNFHDIMNDQKANELYSEFVREKTRERIDDPDVAKKLIPTDYPFGMKRVPMETDYYESLQPRQRSAHRRKGVAGRTCRTRGNRCRR